MEIYAGFDCGGTSTRCALADERGKLLGIGKGGASNYLFCGRETALQSLKTAIKNAFAAAGIPEMPIKRSFIASAAVEVACGGLHEAFFKECIGGELECDSDIIPVRYAASGDKPAIAVIAGTGAVVYALYPNRFVKASGWGPLLGDEGSGYDIGLNALRTLTKMSDGRLPLDKEFYSELLKSLDVSEDSPRRLLRALNVEDKRSKIASVTATVNALYRSGNPTAATLLNNAADELEQAVSAVLDRTGDESFPVALSGGTLGADQPLYSLLRERLLKYPRITAVCLPKVSPVITAAAIALKRAGLAQASEELLSTQAKKNGLLFAGYSRKEITPDKPCRLSGFDYRTAPSEGTLDPIYVSVAAVKDMNGEKAVFASFDLLGVSSYLCEDMKKAVSERLSVKENNIFIFATHTHAAPMAVFRSLPAYSKEYSDSVVNALVEAAAEAFAGLSPACVKTANTEIYGVASLRDKPREASAFAMPSDNILFETESGGDILLCAYACHATVFDEKNLLISRDLPGGCEKVLGGRYKTVFFNGACADLSCRYTKTAPTDSERNRLGGIWADGVKKAIESARLSEFSLTSAEEKLFIPPAAFFTEQQRAECRVYLAKKIDVCADESTKREYASCLAVINRTNYGKTAGETVRLGFADLGGFGLLTLPFETPSGDGAEYRMIAEELCKKKVVLACYSGGYDGYLPSGRPLDFDSGYEDMASIYTSDAKNIVSECIKRCVKATMSAQRNS